jgi:hypothetical protein
LHSQHFLWSVNCNYFIPIVIGQQAYWFISKIRMCLTAHGASVAVKRKTLNSSTSVRNFLYKRLKLGVNRAYNHSGV